MTTPRARKALCSAALAAVLLAHAATAMSQPAPTRTPAPAPSEGVSLTLGARALGLTLDARELPVGSCGGLRCDPSETWVTGRGLNLARRTWLGAELVGGLDLRPLYLRAGLGFGWDTQGRASILPVDGRRLSTTGIATVITVAAGVRPRWSRGSVLLGVMVGWFTLPARRGDGDLAETGAAHALLWGLELGVENRLKRGVDLSTALRLGYDLSVSLVFGVVVTG
ncbi:MAG: hypothetical protein HY909_14905 [Deltaproteobacteria bacterium]|nr:hypothetical protein [Deltaproteobacteria bacterium]